MQEPNGDPPKALHVLTIVHLLSLKRGRSALSRYAIRTPKCDSSKCIKQTSSGPPNQPSSLVFVQACLVSLSSNWKFAEHVRRSMKAKEQGKDITRQIGATKQKKLKESKVGTRQSHSEKYFGDSPKLLGEANVPRQKLQKGYGARLCQEGDERGIQRITNQVSEARLTSPSDSDAEILRTYKCNFQKKKNEFRKNSPVPTLSSYGLNLQHSKYCSYNF
uniref:Uncharacterized protein n=1 Tax=Solanum tuberosum TaxID=4113 RepID=M1DX67_SOLTU